MTITSSFSNIAGLDENGDGSDFAHWKESSRESNCDSGERSFSTSSNTDLAAGGLLHITTLNNINHNRILLRERIQ